MSDNGVTTLICTVALAVVWGVVPAPGDRSVAASEGYDPLWINLWAVWGRVSCGTDGCQQARTAQLTVAGSSELERDGRDVEVAREARREGRAWPWCARRLAGQAWKRGGSGLPQVVHREQGLPWPTSHAAWVS